MAPMDFLRLPLIAAVGAALYGETLDEWVAAGACLACLGNWLNLRGGERPHESAKGSGVGQNAKRTKSIQLSQQVTNGPPSSHELAVSALSRRAECERNPSGPSHPSALALLVHQQFGLSRWNPVRPLVSRISCKNRNTTTLKGDLDLLTALTMSKNHDPCLEQAHSRYMLREAGRLIDVRRYALFAAVFVNDKLIRQFPYQPFRN